MTISLEVQDVAGAQAFGHLLDAVLPDGKGLAAVIHAYFDESGTHANSPVTCVAGYLFAAPQAKRFAKQWRKALSEVGLTYFHMSEFAHGRGDFASLTPAQRLALSKTLVKLIREHMSFGWGVMASQAEYEQVAPDWYQWIHPDVYSMSLNWAMSAVVGWADHAGYAGRIAYFFESGHRYGKHVNARLEQIARVQRVRDAWRYSSHSFVSKGDAPPLDAADFLAWQLHKYRVDTLDRLHDNPRRPRKDFDSLVNGQWDKYYFPHLEGDGLKRYLATVQPPKQWPPPPNMKPQDYLRRAADAESNDA